MTYRVEEIESRLRSGEDSGWEFKQVEFDGDRPKRPSCTVWADEVAAFANAAGGVVLAGVADDGEVVDMSPAQLANLDSLLVEVSTDTIKPPVRIRTHHRELSDGKLVLLVEVPESDSVHESPGGNFIRVGASKRLMGGDERLRLAQRRSQARFLWFDKQPVPETGFRTLAERLWKPLLSAEGAAEPAAALGKLALLEDDKAGILRATVAGVLLCTPNPEQWLPNAYIVLARKPRNMLIIREDMSICTYEDSWNLLRLGQIRSHNGGFRQIFESGKYCEIHLRRSFLRHASYGGSRTRPQLPG